MESSRGEVLYHSIVVSAIVYWLDMQDSPAMSPLLIQYTSKVQNAATSQSECAVANARSSSPKKDPTKSLF